MYYFNETKGIYIEESTGAAYYTTRGAANVLGVASQTLDYRVRTAKISGVKAAEIQTVQGLRTAKIIPATEVYELAFEFNPELAKAMGKAGAVLFAQREAGWQPKPTKPLSQLQMIAALATELHEQQEALSVVNAKVDRLEAFAPDEDYYSITAYFNKNKRKFELPASASVVGKALVKRSQVLGYEVVLQSFFGF